ncbi:hypothetical protein [Arthrobacter sp. ISL-69]|uniref:hypothetical protein n=1 Tax=Arthrobacter sp. ISL-69 TaxID=2819113 RepID=UPI001BE6EDBF|nr:hypothetical protein [Arthrobacter sp. ISL-69]MBT2537241.1 hypothetical protein [Arthrobacter sp. ISL-69]
MTAENMTVYIEEDGVCECQWCIHGATSGEYLEVIDAVDNIKRLSDWHDHAHGLTLWSHCAYAPCNILTDEFRRTP